MHNAYKPLSGVEIEPTQENFPALQHFFKINEAPGTTTITDSVGGVVISPLLIGAYDGTKLASAASAGDDSLDAGSWAALGTKEVLICVMGTWTTAGSFELTIGTQASNVRYRMTESVTAFNDGSNAVFDTTNLIADGTDSIAYLWMDKSEASAGVRKGFAAAAGITDVTAAGDGTSLDASINAPDSVYSFDGFANIYGIAVFHFDTIPDDWQIALQWMRQQWVAGNKLIYPGWKDLV